MSVDLRLMVRISITPRPARTGSLAVDLAALRRHAATTRWVPASPPPSAEAMQRGAGPSGIRVGLAFFVDGTPWSVDDTPGELSPTTGLDLRDVAVWAEAIQALESGPATAQVQDVRFRLTPRGSDVEIVQHDIDGSIEATLRLPRAALDEGLDRALTHARTLADALPDLPGADALPS